MLWMKVTNDKYELPIAIAESAYELADMLGINANVIYSQMSHFKAGRTKSCPYIQIKEGDEDERHDLPPGGD